MTAAQVPEATPQTTVAVSDLAVWVAKGASTGEVASLRRMDPVRPPPLTLYKVAARFLPPGWDRDRDHVHDWMTVIAGVAITAPDGHRPATGLGRALARAGLSEANLERLLASRDDTRRTLLLRVARFLSAKSEGCDWAEVAHFLLARTDQAIERVNMRAASGYYREVGVIEARQKKE